MYQPSGRIWLTTYILLMVQKSGKLTSWGNGSLSRYLQCFWHPRWWSPDFLNHQQYDLWLLLTVVFFVYFWRPFSAPSLGLRLSNSTSRLKPGWPKANGQKNWWSSGSSAKIEKNALYPLDQQTFEQRIFIWNIAESFSLSCTLRGISWAMQKTAERWLFSSLS